MADVPRAPRRVVVGVDRNGRSVVVADTEAPRTHAFAQPKGMRTTLLWKLGVDSPDPAAAETTKEELWDCPGPGEITFSALTVPPDSVFQSDFDPIAAGDEQQRVSPTLAGLFVADGEPGFHTTDTTDFAVVTEGELVLVLDNGVEVTLKPGDTVVQNATRHAWRNPGPRPASAVFVMVGARGRARV